MKGPTWLASWISEVNAVRALADHYAGHESLEVQSLVVENTGCFRIGRVVELEAAVEDEIVDDITAYSAAYCIRRINNDDINPVNRQLTCRCETG